MSILDTAVPVSEDREAITALIYGDSGVGKTRFAGSGRNNGKDDLIIAVEHGVVSASRSGSETNVLKPKNWDELDEIINAVTDEPDRFDWVILDSLTQLQDFIWDEIIESQVSKNPHRSAFKKELQEYGEAQERLKSVVNRLLNSGANVIFTALSEDYVDEEGNTGKMPSIHGKKGALAQWVAAKPDIVGYLSVAKTGKGQIYRRMQFNKTPSAYAKDRFDIFDKPQANLTLEKFTDTLLAAGEDQTKESAN